MGKILHININPEWISAGQITGHWEYTIPEYLINDWREYISLIKKDTLTPKEKIIFDEYKDVFNDYREFILDDYEINGNGDLDLSTYDEYYI